MLLAVLLVLASAIAGLSVVSGSEAAVGYTRYGAVVKPYPGESYPAALSRVEARYGRLGVVRYFDPNEPQSWTSIAGKIGARNAVISFRIPPREVLSGRWDSYLSSWFRSAPTGRYTWAVYMHEPEDDIVRGEYSAQDYRAAFARVSYLRAKAGNPWVRSTLVLMCWTANPRSGRDWRYYWAGTQYVQSLGFDCYNHGYGAGGYGTPAGLMGNALSLARATGKPFGIAELGSLRTPGDAGPGRAAWLVNAARWLHATGAEYVSYFDTNGGARAVDYRLSDVWSQQAWRSVVYDQQP